VIDPERGPVEWGCSNQFINLCRDFSQKVRNNHITSIRLPKMKPLSENLAFKSDVEKEKEVIT
jgi:hypothetical protein